MGNKPHPRRGRVHLKVERGRLNGLLLFARQLRQAIGKRVGDSEVQVRIANTRATVAGRLESPEWAESRDNPSALRSPSGVLLTFATRSLPNDAISAWTNCFGSLRRSSRLVGIFVRLKVRIFFEAPRKFFPRYRPASPLTTRCRLAVRLRTVGRSGR